jgi:hypothetical protein
MKELRQQAWRDSRAEYGSSSLLFLPSFLLLYSPAAPLAILSSLPKFEPLVRGIDSMS